MTEMAALNTLLAQELRANLAEAGCPVCRLLRDHEDRYWDGLLYEGFQDGGVLASFTASIGLCRRHADQLGDYNDPFAAAQLALASLTGAQRALDAAGRPGRRRPEALGAPGDGCPACASLTASETSALETLGAMIEAEAGTRERYEASGGVCFDHLRRALELDVAGEDVLRERLRETLQARRRAVEALIAAHDHRHAESTASDPGSWRRALAALRDDPGSRARPPVGSRRRGRRLPWRGASR